MPVSLVTWPVFQKKKKSEEEAQILQNIFTVKKSKKQI